MRNEGLVFPHPLLAPHQASLQSQRLDFFQVPDTEMLQEPHTFISTDLGLLGAEMTASSPGGMQTELHKEAKLSAACASSITNMQKQTAFSKKDSDGASGILKSQHISWCDKAGCRNQPLISTCTRTLVFPGFPLQWQSHRINYFKAILIQARSRLY